MTVKSKVVRDGPLELSTLTALVALVEERSTTRAAVRLGITQSGSSHALRRLRSRLGDPLLVRGRDGMQPTPRALELHARASRILAEVELLAAPVMRFDPGTAQRSFTIAADDNMSLHLLPPLLVVLSRQAPGVNMRVVPPSSNATLALEQGDVDLLISPRDLSLPGFYARRLFDETFTCVARENHPSIGRRPSLERFAAVGHALVSARGRSFVDDALAEHGLRRRIVLRLPHFIACARVVAVTDLVTTLPRRLVKTLAIPSLRPFTSPVPLPRLTIHAVWHERMNADLAHRWLRECLAGLAARAPAPTT